MFLSLSIQLKIKSMATTHSWYSELSSFAQIDDDCWEDARHPKNAEFLNSLPSAIQIPQEAGLQHNIEVPMYITSRLVTLGCPDLKKVKLSNGVAD